VPKSQYDIKDLASLKTNEKLLPKHARSITHLASCLTTHLTETQVKKKKSRSW